MAAAGQLAEATETHRRAALAEEGARRNKEGPAAETETLARLNAATDVLARYRIPAEETAAAKQAAVARVAAAEGNVAACEDARDRAVRVVEQLQDPRLQFSARARRGRACRAAERARGHAPAETGGEPPAGR